MRTARNSNYWFDDLGWVQFERLCTELMELEVGVPIDRWLGRADTTRVAVIDDAVALPTGGRTLAGPVLVAVVWARPWSQPPNRWSMARRGLGSAIEEVLAEPDPDAPKSVLLLTNLEPGPTEIDFVRVTLAAALEGPIEVAVLGPRDLSAIVDARPELRRRVPSVLGVRDLDELIPAELVQGSSADVEAARMLARVFVPTRTYARTLGVLVRHHFAVLTGPPEMGKTAIARTIGLALMTEGWEVHECIRPDDLWHRFARDRPQLFIADDAFGSTEYTPEAAERWALDLDRVLRAMDERHWLIWTSRPAPLKAGLRRIHREHGVERFPQPAEVHVDSADLDVEEKALILFRHAKAARLPRSSVELVQTQAWEIVSHPHFTPERIRQFVTDRLPDLAEGSSALTYAQLADAVVAEIREPTTAMATSLRALPAEHRALLVALIDAPPGPVPERELAAAARRHSTSGFPRPLGELVDRLTDHFVRAVPPMSVTWVHPSWRDLVINELAGDAAQRRRFLSRCSIEGVLLALSVGGGAAGERKFPLLVDDGDWDSVTERLRDLVPELDDALLYRVLAALDAAVESAPDGPSSSEAEALAANVLDVIRRRWDATHAAISATLLGAWFIGASRLRERPAAPDLTATWIELVPTSPIDIDSVEDLNRFDEWLRVVDVLHEHEPAVRQTLGFPERQAPVIAAFLDAAAASIKRDGEAAARRLLAQCLRRLATVAPDQAPGARALAAALAPREERAPSAYDWTEPERERRPRGGSIVMRILSDLAPSAEI